MRRYKVQPNLDINTSPTLQKYLYHMLTAMMLYYPETPIEDLKAAILYSIQKRMTNVGDIQLINTYMRRKADPNDQTSPYIDHTQTVDLQKMSDYILSRKPIVTAFGTMFRHHGDVPNPLVETVIMFMNNRGIHKEMMFQFPRGSEDFEKYNLMQVLTVIVQHPYTVTCE